MALLRGGDGASLNTCYAVAPATRSLGVGSGSPAGAIACGRRRTTHRICIGKKTKHHRLYLLSGKIASAAMYFRRVRVAGRSFAATLVTPPAHKSVARASGDFAGGRRRAGKGQLGRCAAEQSKYYRLYYPQTQTDRGTCPGVWL